MSNTDRYHDATRATLFDAWYNIQPPNVQERMNTWMLVAAAEFRRVQPTTADTALEMAQALLWAVANKDMKQFLSVLKG